MYKQALGKKLQSLVREPVLFNEPMRKHTTWKIGGPADYFLCPSSIDELRNVLLLCQEENIPFFVMGNGSNILVGDNGILGLVIKMGDKFANCHWKQDGVDVESGAMLPYLALEAVKQGFGGLEFAAGIPGSIGGAIRMNAGAYGNNIGNLVTKVTALEYNGTIREIKADELSFAYRNSSLFALKAIVCSVSLALPKGNKEKSTLEIQELLKLRALKQPLDFPSCGSVFRNPQNDHAGRLIEMAGLRGLKVGGAAVSKKHGNFIINIGGAQAQDVLSLIEQVQKKVKAFSGIELETEVKTVGQFLGTCNHQ